MTTMPSYSKHTQKDLQKNFEFMLYSPIVEKLQKKLKKMKKENRSLRRILTRIGEEPINVIDLNSDNDEKELDMLHVKGTSIAIKEEPHIVYNIEEQEEEEVEYEEEEEEEYEEEEEEYEEEESEEEEEGGQGGESPLEEEEEVFEVVIDSKTYFTADAENGEIYGVVDEDEVGDAVGMFKNGKARFYTA